jgi:hypothetical protein
MEAKEPVQRSAVKAASRRSRSREARALTALRWSGSSLPCDHGWIHHAEHARQTATLRWVALGILIPNAFSVEAALGRFVRCRYSAIQNNVQTNTYDPRRHGATPSLLSCRPNQPRILYHIGHRRSFAARSKSIPPLAAIRNPAHWPRSYNSVRAPIARRRVSQPLSNCYALVANSAPGQRC